MFVFVKLKYIFSSCIHIKNVISEFLDDFTTQNGLKQEDALSPLLFSFGSEDATRSTKFYYMVQRGNVSRTERGGNYAQNMVTSRHQTAGRNLVRDI